jgi:tol-pal system protein YbgF
MLVAKPAGCDRRDRRGGDAVGIAALFSPPLTDSIMSGKRCQFRARAQSFAGLGFDASGRRPAVRSMNLYRRTAFQLALLLLVAAMQAGTAWAQDPSLAVRMSAMEEQMRQLYGQIEELNIQMMQLKEQMQQVHGAAGERRQTSQAGGADPLTGEASGQNGVERIDEGNDLYAYQTGELDEGTGAEQITGGLQQAPGPQPLGTLPGPAAGALPDAAPGGLQLGAEPADPGQPVVPEQVETASLDNAAPAADTPEKLYELSYESLLRRRYGEAEAGFRTFVQKHSDHELAGNAEFWLGETYYVQSNYKAAAQAFLTGYQTYPENRKAPDSLLKLGMSLSQLGQKDQACAAFATVDAKFPKAVETRKRARDESEKSGC